MSLHPELVEYMPLVYQKYVGLYLIYIYIYVFMGYNKDIYIYIHVYFGYPLSQTRRSSYLPSFCQP
jgi:hypothetical protein